MSNESEITEDKSETLDGLTKWFVIGAFGIGVVLLMAMLFSPASSSHPKIAVLDTAALVQSLSETRRGGADRNVVAEVQARADELAAEGYIVLRKETLWAAPNEHVIVITE